MVEPACGTLNLYQRTSSCVSSVPCVVPVEIGLALARELLVSSNAPISGCSWLRVTPRWSMSGHQFVLAASIAGLPGSSACVKVGPPLSANGPSSGSCDGIEPPQLVPGNCKLP